MNRFKVAFTEQAKAWTASVSVEGEEGLKTLDEAYDLAKRAQAISQQMTLQKIRS
jgi:hypothetical protein